MGSKSGSQLHFSRDLYQSAIIFRSLKRALPFSLKTDKEPKN